MCQVLGYSYACMSLGLDFLPTVKRTSSVFSMIARVLELKESPLQVLSGAL